MIAFDAGRIWGAIFIAGVPTAAFTYYWCAVRYGNKWIGMAGLAACMLSGVLGGLILALPTVGVFMLANWFFSKRKKAASPLAAENTKTEQTKIAA